MNQLTINLDRLIIAEKKVCVKYAQKGMLVKKVNKVPKK